jgi:phosphoribosylaminoimidazole-succinocarboxamide synthase
MKTKDKIYSGTTKTLYELEDPSTLLLSFNDHFKLPDKKIIEIAGKGVLNNSISSLLMSKLDLVGIPHHFIEKLNMRQQLIQFVDALPVQVHITSVACGRYVTEFGLEEGYVFDAPLIDFRIKNSDLNYPIINESQIISFNWMALNEINDLKRIATRVHDFISGLFAGIGVRMVECKLEFGRFLAQDDFGLMLVDELSPDNCRLWDMYTNEKLCFEVADESPDLVIAAYQEIWSRFNNNHVSVIK